jgi:hypothetical protein
MHRFFLFLNVQHLIGHEHWIQYVNGVQEHLNLLDKYFKNKLDSVLEHKIRNLKRILKFVLFYWGISHVPKFEDASKFPTGDTHPPCSHPHLLEETPHLQNSGICDIAIFIQKTYLILNCRFFEKQNVIMNIWWKKLVKWLYILLVFFKHNVLLVS